MIESFITTLAWFGLVIGIVSVALDFHTFYVMDYTHGGTLKKMTYKMEGKRYVHRPPKKAALVAIICAAWLITVY